MFWWENNNYNRNTRKIRKLWQKTLAHTQKEWGKAQQTEKEFIPNQNHQNSNHPKTTLNGIKDKEDNGRYM